jgi:hypothetical protein
MGGMSPNYDFNVLEKRAAEFVDAGRPQDAIKIYLFMSDGDPSLDGGYLGKKLGECYELAGDPHAAKYWYGRAVEETPTFGLIVLRRVKGSLQFPSTSSCSRITVDEDPPHPPRAFARVPSLSPRFAGGEGDVTRPLII